MCRPAPSGATYAWRGLPRLCSPITLALRERRSALALGGIRSERLLLALLCSAGGLLVVVLRTRLTFFNDGGIPFVVGADTVMLVVRRRPRQLWIRRARVPVRAVMVLLPAQAVLWNYRQPHRAPAAIPVRRGVGPARIGHRHDPRIAGGDSVQLSCADRARRAVAGVVAAEGSPAQPPGHWCSPGPH